VHGDDDRAAEVTQLEGAGPSPPHAGDEHSHRVGADTRERILIAAVTLFVRQGFAGTSVRDITERTRLTKAALYYHFASKEAVLDAVVEPLVEEIRSLVRSAGADGERADPEGVLAGLVDVLSRRVGVLRILMADPSVTKRPDHQRATEGMERMARAIARSDAPGDVVAARCAIAAAQGGVVATVAHAGDILAVAPDQERLRKLLAGEEHLLDADQRRQVVDAAMRALG
jgi:AcrR family transcriptional regulator